MRRIMPLIPALLKDDALLADIREAPACTGAARLWWLGQSGFLIQWDGHFLLLDPYLSDSLTEKYAATDKPHTRLSEQAIDPARLDMVEVVTSSHNHTDHLDAATLIPLARANPALQMVLPAANINFARGRLGVDAPAMTGLDDGMEATVGAFHFTGIAAAHNDIARDAEGRCLFLGFLVRFGPFCLYHSGDTLWHDGLVAALRHAPRLDAALVPINGNRPERRVAGNLNGTEAAALAKAAAARLAVPHHFNMFAFNTEPLDEFLTACARLQQPCRVLQTGECLTLEA
jgi:L-ascorbate metabolism protein UlaG (beta-lactamase superfamily)